MELFQRDGSDKWWLTYSIAGKRFRESTGTHVKREAEAILAKRRVEIFEGRHFPEKKRNDLTVAGLRDLWNEHAQHKADAKKDKQKLGVIVEFFGANALVATLAKRDSERFRDTLAARVTRSKRKTAPATVNRYLALWRAALNHVQGDYLHRNPMAGVAFLPERNQRERECEAEEYESLLGRADADMRLALVLAYEQGMRRTEICRSLRAQVSTKRREIQVPADASKNTFPRTVPLTKRALAEIEAAPVRMDGRLVALEPDTVTHRFTGLCSALGIEGLHFHDLRGTAITRLSRAGASLAELQKFSGHKSVQALMRYLKRGDRRLRELVDKMDAADGGRHG
ncbi:MAG: site-specific integrase [Deltaproteobacteria bacterium]|nr:site-specific integrase [Deltaproteobacteria bacterium]